jgi:hypothetical protein
VHPVRRYQISGRAFVVQGGINRRGRPSLGDPGKDAFGAAALVEVIVNEGDGQF